MKIKTKNERMLDWSEIAECKSKVLILSIELANGSCDTGYAIEQLRQVAETLNMIERVHLENEAAFDSVNELLRLSRVAAVRNPLAKQNALNTTDIVEGA